MGDRRHAPPAGPQIDFCLSPEGPRHSNDSAGVGIMADHGISLMIANEHDPRPIKVEIVEHPRIGSLDIAETGNMLEPATGQPAYPPFVGIFGEDDIPVFRLTLGQADTAALKIRTHRAASISFEP